MAEEPAAQTAPPEDRGSDEAIAAFVDEFMRDYGFLPALPTEEDDEPVEAIHIELPSKPKRQAPPSMLKQGRAWLEGLFEGMRLQVAPTSRYDKSDRTLYFDLEGEDRRELLGASGHSPRVIEGIEKVLYQFLELDGSDYDLHVDVDNFRRERSQRLRSMALELAELSEQVDKSITIAGMNEFERRVVHRRLRDESRIKTDSFGYGTFRKIRIEPA